MPTVTKKMPSSSPLNGSRSTSIWWRYSLSLSSRPGEEGAERDRQPRRAGRGRNTDHDGQRDRHDQFAAAGARRRAHQRRHHIAADHHDHRDGGEGLRERQKQIDQRLVAGAARFQNADGEQHRHHHQILEQQHRQRHAPDRRRGAVLVDQKLHHDRGRRQRETHAENRGPRAA